MRLKQPSLNEYSPKIRSRNNAKRTSFPELMHIDVCILPSHRPPPKPGESPRLHIFIGESPDRVGLCAIFCAWTRYCSPNTKLRGCWDLAFALSNTSSHAKIYPHAGLGAAFS